MTDLNEVYDMCEKIYEYEVKSGCKSIDRLTYWFRDYNLRAPKPGVTNQQIIKKYNEIKKKRGLT